MKKSYGFFGKWKNFYLHPFALFESLLLEPVERTATIIVPQLIILFSLFYFVTSLQMEFFSGYYFLRGFTFGSFIAMSAAYFFFIHGFLRLMEGSGAIADSFTVYGYSVLFVNYTSLILMVLGLLSILIHPVVAIIPLIVMLILQFWGLVSMIIGLGIAHNIGAFRTFVAIFLAGIVGTLVYVAISGMFFYFLV